MITKFITYIKEDSNQQRLTTVGEPIRVKDLYKSFNGNKIELIKYLNEKYKDKIIKIENVVGDEDNMIIILVDEFVAAPNSKMDWSSTDDKIFVKYQQYSFNEKSNLIPVPYVADTIIAISSDVICEMKYLDYQRKYTDDDPYGEEEWEN